MTGRSGREGIAPTGRSEWVGPDLLALLHLLGGYVRTRRCPVVRTRKSCERAWQIAGVDSSRADAGDCPEWGQPGARGGFAQARRSPGPAFQGRNRSSAGPVRGVGVRPHMSVGVRPDVSVPAGGSCHGSGVRGERGAVFEPVAGAVDGEHVAVVQQSVEDGGGYLTTALGRPRCLRRCGAPPRLAVVDALSFRVYDGNRGSRAASDHALGCGVDDAAARRPGDRAG